MCVREIKIEVKFAFTLETNLKIGQREDRVVASVTWGLSHGELQIRRRVLSFHDNCLTIV